MKSEKALYGIIGNPLKHSLSPVMHNTAFKELEVDAEYRLFPLDEDELKGFFDELKSPDSPIFGFNVTVPYKEKVIQYMDHVTPLVEKLGAVNTVVIDKDRKLTGHNTDAPGFLAQLSEIKFTTNGKRVAILGAGGSARAIVGALCMISDRPDSIKIYNRTESRLDALLKDLGERIDVSFVEPVSYVDDLNVELADLLINTTSVGLKEDDIPLVDPDMLHSNLTVYDLIYNPRETELLKDAKRCGAKAVNGLGMLFYQGVLAFQHWANVQLDEEIKIKMRVALEEALRYE